MTSKQMEEKLVIPWKNDKSQFEDIIFKHTVWTNYQVNVEMIEHVKFQKARKICK